MLPSFDQLANSGSGMVLEARGICSFFHEQGVLFDARDIEIVPWLQFNVPQGFQASRCFKMFKHSGVLSIG